MRIVLVNWARLWDGTRVGGGVNGYAQALALALADRGHDVCWLCSGVHYRPGPDPDAPGPCEIRRHPDWFGVRVFEVLNSPVLAPSLCQFRRPMDEVSAPDLEHHVRTLLGQLEPDVVHFHNLEGLSAGCVRAARESGAAVVFSLHNYHTICPQVYLLQGHRVPCRSFQSGHACAGCVDAPDPARERADRIASARRTPSDSQPPRHRTSFLRDLRAFIAGTEQEPQRGSDSLPPPGLPLQRVGVDGPLPLGREEHRGQAALVRSLRQPQAEPDPDAPECAPLDNDPTPDPIGPAPNAYGVRRRAMIDMLNACDRVLAVSRFVRDKFVALGVRPDVVRVMHIGTRMTAIVQRHRELVFDPPPFDPPRPVRMVFMGTNHWYKGLPLLADALERLSPADLGRIDLAVHAFGGETIRWRFNRLEPRLARLRFSTAYEPQDVPWICGGKDLGIVPSVWWDNAPQTVMEFQACGLPVLGADLGGIPDFVRDGHNGLLFRGNDRDDLADHLRGVVRDPDLLRRLRANVRPPTSIEAHAAEMEAEYRSLIRPRAIGAAQ